MARERGEAVLDPTKRLDALAARYNAGEREPAFLLEFIQALGSAGMNAEVQQVVKEWLGSLSLDQLATPGDLVDNHAVRERPVVEKRC